LLTDNSGGCGGLGQPSSFIKGLSTKVLVAIIVLIFVVIVILSIVLLALRGRYVKNFYTILLAHVIVKDSSLVASDKKEAPTWQDNVSLG
jgi:hypothetical protein